MDWILQYPSNHKLQIFLGSQYSLSATSLLELSTKVLFLTATPQEP
ncbi:hypothetical protein SynA1840_02590 [Synechococcus sp. A18-40]|nr:hypothetical protein SynA1840_02590 [Synechococcus sp. A18-40]